MNLYEDIQVHDTLNPKLWEGTLLKKDVKEKLVTIVANFEEYLDAPIDIVDVQLVGSNASYNYTENSDLDVHIIANFETTASDTELLQALCNVKKTSFNKNYDITIKGIDVELYVQDVKTNITSNGIYSICEDRWIKEPKQITSIKHHDTTEELAKWEAKIAEILQNSSYETITEAINILYLIRHNSIAVDGEYGKGNQLFKELRNKGLIQALKEALNTEVSKRLSLESLSEGQIVNRFK